MVDVMHGSPSPALVLSLIEGLPPESNTVADMSGGPQFRGWGLTEAILADVFDAISMNTIVSGNWKRNPPKPPVYPRPTVKPKKPTTIAALRATFGQGG